MPESYGRPPEYLFITLIRALFLSLFVALVACSGAKPQFLKVFMAAYKIKPESEIGKARCLNCHQPPHPPIRNSYGKAVENAMDLAQARVLTADILKTVEHKDGGDGVPFLAKIKADIPPGSPKKPKAPAKAKPAGKKHASVLTFGVGLAIVTGFSTFTRRPS